MPKRRLECRDKFERRSLLSISALFAIAFLAGCTDSEGDGAQRSTSAATETRPTTGGPGVDGEIGRDQGETNTSIDSDAYFKPLHEPIAWTEEKLEAALGELPSSCSEDAPVDATSENVAVAVRGECKVVSRANARGKIDDLGKLYALQGIDLAAVLRDKAASATEMDERVAEPEIDLGHLVGDQLAALDANGRNGGIGTASIHPLAGNEGEEEWVGGGRTMTLGSEQFSGTASGFFHVFRKKGVGVYAAGDVTGKAFGVQRQLVYANLEAKGLNGERGQAKAVVRAFGRDLFNQTFDEPQTTGERNLASLNTTQDGNIRFSVGPVPFNVTWSFRVQGSVPVTYTLRPTAAEANLKPNIVATVGLQGGPDIVVASAGVGGAFTIVDTDFNARADASIQTRDNALSVCTNATAAFNLKNMMGGRLFAFAQVGRPDSRILGVPLGWRGELEFVNWEGATRNFDIVSETDRCYAAL